MPGRRYRALGRRTLVIALASIATIFLAQALVSTLWTSQANADARRVSAEALASVDLVTTIMHDVDDERILVDDHIFEQGAGEMAKIEDRIARVDRDLEHAIADYGPLADQLDERTAWQRVLDSLQQFRTAVGKALERSRVNDNTAAHAAIASVESDYDALERAVDDLVDINRTSARAAAARHVDLETSAAATVVATQLVGLLGLVLVGWWGFRRVANFEKKQGEVRMLEARNHELDAFAGRVAHDLRNPLSSILFTTELLAEARLPDIAPQLDRIRRSSRRVEALIDDLLALSRAGAPAAGARSNPAAIVANVAEDFAERFADEATLRTEVAPANVPYGETLLEQAIWNLVENGVKYRRPGVAPRIEISGHVEGDRYALRVSDNGMGMTADEASRAFEPFYRGSTPGTTGTGLGLAIVKRVIEARGGTTSIEPRAEAGTTVVLSLPQERAR